MMVMSLLTARQRVKHGKFSNKEDAVAAGQNPSNQYDLKKSLESNDEVERIRRAHMNDVENIYPFLIIGILFILTVNPDYFYLQLHFRLFVIVRYLHTFVYLFAVRQPARGFMFALGLLCNISMIF